MDIDWQVFGALLSIVTLLDGMNFWAVKWLVNRNNELLIDRLNQRLDKDIAQDKEMQEISSEQRQVSVSMADHYMRKDEAATEFKRLEEKIDTIWAYLLEKRPGSSNK